MIVITMITRPLSLVGRRELFLFLGAYIVYSASRYVSIGDHHSTKPLHEVATLEETRFNGLKRECGIHEINLADL